MTPLFSLNIAYLDLEPIVVKGGIEIDEAQKVTHRREHTFPDMVSAKKVSGKPFSHWPIVDRVERMKNRRTEETHQLPGEQYRAPRAPSNTPSMHRLDHHR